MIGTTVEQILAFNDWQSRKYVEHRPLRQKHREQVNTAFRPLCCMDGRVMPHGILDGLLVGVGRTWQNAGAIFKPQYWPGFKASVEEDQRHLEQRGRGMLLVACGHGSDTDPKLGCKAHQFDPARTLAASWALRGQLDEMFASKVKEGKVRSICAWINTDTDSMTFYGFHGEKFDVATAVHASPPEIRDRLAAIYGGDLPEQMIADLAYYAHLNARHVGKVMRKKRSLLEIDHRESMIYVGQSPEAVCQKGQALVLGPFDPSLSSWVKTGGEILQSNVKKYGLSHGHQLALVTGIPYHPSENEALSIERKNKAGHQARHLAGRALQAINDSVKGIVNNLETLTGVICMDTLKFEPID